MSVCTALPRKVKRYHKKEKDKAKALRKEWFNNKNK